MEEEASRRVKQHLPFLGDGAKQYVFESLGGAGKWNEDHDKDDKEDHEEEIAFARVVNGAAALQQQLGLVHYRAPSLLLDKLGVSRASVYQTLEERIKANLYATLDSLPETGLLVMLDQTIEFIDHSDLSVVPLHIIKSIKKLPDKYLIYIAQKNVTTDLPISVLRQIWEYNPALFIRHISEKYLNRMEINSSIVNSISITTQENINQIVSCIGGSERLFISFASHCCDELVQRKEPAYGVLLRAVLLCLESNTNNKLTTLGKLYELARLLDSCKRSKKLDETSFMGVIELLKVIIIAQYNSHMSGVNSALGTSKESISNRKEKKMQPIKRKMKTPSSHTPLQSLLLDAWQYICKLDTAHVFAYPVTDDIAPNYSRVITAPMDLGTIGSKIESSEYKDVSEFDDDVNLTFSNCILYNGAASFYGELASKLCEKWETKRKEIRSKATAISSSVAGSKRTNDLTRRLEEALNYMIKLDNDKIFYFRVTDAIAPGYSTYIKNPMDFSTMKKKLEAEKYSSIDTFDYDMKVIFDNCIIYNGADSVFGKLAHSLYQKWKNKMKDLVQQDKSANGTAATTGNVVATDDTEEKFCYCQQPAHGDMIACENEQCPLEWFHLDCVHMTEAPDGEWYCTNCAPVLSKYDTVIQTTRQAVTAPDNNTTAPKASDHSVPKANAPAPIFRVEAIDSISSLDFLHKLLDHAWSYVTYLDSDAVFAYPVQSEEYRKIIHNPMDMSTIRVKLGRKKYKALSDFNADIMLMLQNCLQFNQAGSYYHQTGQNIKQQWEVYYAVLQGILAGERTSSICDTNNDMDIVVPEVDDTPYCSCRQPSSFGDMVECEGSNCKINWYHLKCVKLKSIPDGAWICKDCISSTTVTSSTLGKRKVTNVTSNEKDEGPNDATAVTKTVDIVKKTNDNSVPAATSTSAVTTSSIDQIDSVKQIQRAIMIIASSTRSSFKEIPPIIVEHKILWALCLLRDPFFQKLLRLFIVDRLRVMFAANLKINPLLTVKSTPFSLPSDDAILQLGVQLCQLSGSDRLEITSTNTQYLRCHLPLLFLHKLKIRENNIGKNMNFEESKSVVAGLSSTNRALKLLAMDVLQTL